MFDWYHSGYEHNSWYAAPGNPGKGSIIFDEETFFHETTPLRKVTITPAKGGSGHGSQCLTVSNEEDGEWAALAQDGKYLVREKSYSFSGMMRSEGGPIVVFPVGNITHEYSRKEFVFNNIDLDGYATFSLWIPPKSAITVDDFSLKPTDNYYGWRQEAVEVFKKVNPGVVRFPGGCFASFYDWKEGIGPLSERVPTDSYFWGGQNYNDVGTAEFAMLCKAAADWVAYCNLPAGTHPMADLRASHGFPEPFGVRFWELDNEVFRWFEAEDYAWAAVVYSREMKKVDPTIQIGLSSYGGRPGP